MNILIKFLMLMYFKELSGVQVLVMEYTPEKDESLTGKQRLELSITKHISIIKTQSRKNGIVILFPIASLTYGRTSGEYQEYLISTKSTFNPCNARQGPQCVQKLSCACSGAKANMIFTLISEDSLASAIMIINSDGSIINSVLCDDEIGAPDLSQSPGIAFQYPTLQNPYQLGKYVGIITTPLFGFKYSVEKMLNITLTPFYIIPSNWHSELPFLTAAQMYQMFVDEYKVFIAFSGLKVPELGFGGSGIITPNESYYTYTAIHENDSKTLIDVPDIFNKTMNLKENETYESLASKMDDYIFLQDTSVSRFTSVVLNVENLDHTEELCNNGFCCTISYSILVNEEILKETHYVYHLVAYSGSKSYYSIFKPGGVQICGIIACLDDNVLSCGRKLPKYSSINWPVSFQTINIQANFTYPCNYKIYCNMQFPNSLLSSIRPIPSWKTKWIQTISQDNTSQTREFALLEPQLQLMTFAIFARDFSLSGEKNQLKKINWFMIVYMLSVICLLSL